MSGKRIGVFVAWPYANGPLHVGHVGGAILPPDIFARYHRMRGNDVVMVSGSDSHGTPVVLRADAEGVSPADVFRTWHTSFLETFKGLGISFDLFTHTDTPNHQAVAQAMFRRLLNAGALIPDTDNQLYDPIKERYLPDRFVEGTCPHCGYEEARGDQCDNCGRLLDATELIEPRPRGGSGQLEVHEREHYFLDLSQFSERLETWLEGQSDWRVGVRNNALGLVREGLRPRPITRDMSWGVPVPVEGWEDRVMYVWFEAVIGYLSGSVELAELQGQPDDWRRTWYEQEAETHYFIGKDNVTFHAVMWPAMLLGAGHLNGGPDGEGQDGTGTEGQDGPEPGRFNLPTDVVSNEYVNMEGQAMSTSRSYAVWLPDYLERYAPDPLRYYLTINAPESRDTDFVWRDFVRRNNDELLATWGNLVNRVLKFAHSRFDGRVPTPGALAPEDDAIVLRTRDAFGLVGAEIEARRFKSGLNEAMAVAHEVNRYLNDNEPWHTIKTDQERAGTTIYVALQCIDNLHRILAPFLPHTSEAVHGYLGYDGPLFGDIVTEDLGDAQMPHPVNRYEPADGTPTWEPVELAPGQALREPDVIVEKLDEDQVVEHELARLGAQ